MNKFIGIGNLCRDNELKYTPTGKAILKNVIAIKNDYKNSSGQYDSEFINISVWGPSAEYLSKYSKKGAKIAVEGRLTIRDYDKNDGTKGYSTEIVCSNVELLEKINKNEEEHQENAEEELNLYETFGQKVDKEINLDDLQLPFE